MYKCDQNQLPRKGTETSSAFAMASRAALIKTNFPVRGRKLMQMELANDLLLCHDQNQLPRKGTETMITLPLFQFPEQNDQNQLPRKGTET